MYVVMDWFRCVCLDFLICVLGFYYLLGQLMIDCYGNVLFQIFELVFFILRVGWDVYFYVILVFLGLFYLSLFGEQWF